MKQMKRIVAVLLTVILTLAMGVSAFAAEKGSLTVQVNDKNTLENQTISLYKLFDLSVNGNGGYAYSVNPAYQDTLKTTLGLEDTATDVDYYNAVRGLAYIQKFANDFTKAALSAAPALDPTTSVKIDTAADSHMFTDLDYGYYLVHQTGTKSLQSSLVSVDQAENEVNLKGEAPSIEKTADQETVEIGQVVKYTIRGTVPDTTGYGAYVYKLHDTLTDGLDFVDDKDGTPVTGESVKVTVAFDGEDTAADQAPTTAVLSGTGNRTMELDLSEWIRTDNAQKAGRAFTVTYYAKVNANAVVNTKNSAHLEYGNQPGDTTNTTPDEVVTPTYPLDIKKTDTEGAILEGAVFRLYKNEADAKAANDQAVKVTGADGSYTVAEDQTAGTNMDMTTAADEVGTGYNLRLNGLAEGTYWLAETQAPDGYNKLTAPVKVTITKDADNELEWSVEKNDTEEPDKIIDIENSTGSMLPGTGGMGTILFTVVAILLILGVAVSFVISRRKAD